MTPFYRTVLSAAAICTAAACGYKGDLYLPKDGDKARFGVIQTGLERPARKQPAARPVEFKRPQPHQPDTETDSQ